MRHQVLRNGATMFIAAPTGKNLFLCCESELVATGIQGRLKDIDTKLEGFRLSLYRDAFGDGALGITDHDFL